MPVRIYPEEYFQPKNSKIVFLIFSGIIIGSIITLIAVCVGAYIRGKKCQ